MKKIVYPLVSVSILWLLFLIPSLSTSAQELTQAQKQERCQNNKNRIAELETQLRTVDAELSQTMTADEMEDQREQLAFVKMLKTNATSGTYPKNAWDPKKVAQISANCNFNMDKCLERYNNEPSAVKSCLSELEKIIESKIDKDKSLNRLELQAKKNEIEKQIASHKNNLIALGCNANNITNTPDISGTWKALNWIYEFTQNGKTFSWKITNDAVYNETANGEFLEGNRIKATWKNKNGTDSGKATVIVKNGRAIRIEGDNGVALTRN